MSKPYVHAVNSVKKFGGEVDDYIEIHQFMDQSKIGLADPRHRAVFHSTFGIFVVEQVFGYTITNSFGDQVSVRDIAEQHVIEDLGFIPTLEKWLENLPIESWMSLHIIDKPKVEKAEPPSDEYGKVSDYDEGPEEPPEEFKQSKNSNDKIWNEILKKITKEESNVPYEYYPNHPLWQPQRLPFPYETLIKD
jgi:hypothetical protein